MGSSREWDDGEGGNGEGGDVEDGGGDDTIDAAREPPRPPTPKHPRQDLPGREVEVDPTRYEIGEPIGAGGMGEVFAARDGKFGRIVAVKRLRPGKDRARFEREARITARLQHPGIVAVYGVGDSPGGVPFYAMRRVVGESLDEAIKRCETLEDRLGLLPNIIAAGDALAYAHDNEVIHRDLKPKNVLVGDFGETVIIDWGVAKDLTAAPDRPSQQMPAVGGVDTAEGEVIGTAAYMPPEQAEGLQVTPAADIYALGALLYHVLAGRAPYEGETFRDTLDQVRDGRPPPLASIQPLVPRELVTVIEKAMAREPRDRYESVAALVDELKRFQTGQLVEAYDYSRLERVRRFLGRNRAAVAVAVVAVGVLALLAAIGVRKIVDERREAERQRALAAKQSVELLEEQGRQELVAGRSGRALPYLCEALGLGRSTPVMRLLIAEARRAFDKQIARIDAHPGGARMVAFSGDDQRLLTLGVDGRAVLWRRDGARVAELEHDRPVYTAVFSEEGDRNYIATASADGSAAIWSLDGRRQETLAHGAAVLDARFSRFGELLITGAEDGKARVWDVASGELRATLEHDRGLIRVDISEDGRHAAALDETGVALTWSLPGGRKIALDHGDSVRWVSLSTDSSGSRVVTAGRDHTAQIFDTATGRRLATLQGHDGDVIRAVFRLDDTQVLTASRDRTARIFDADSGKLIHKLGGHSDAVNWAGYGHGQTHALTASEDGVLRLWDVETGAPLLRFEGHAGAVTHGAFDRGGELVASAGEDGTVRLWRAANPRRRSSLETQLKIVSADISPDNHRLVTGSTDHTAVLWDITGPTAQKPRGLADLSETVFAVRFSPAGDAVAIGSDRVARIIPLGGGAPIELGVSEPVYAIAFSPSGRRVATAGGTREPPRGTVRVFDAASGRQIAEVEHDEAANSVHFSRDGSRIISASSDATAIVFDVDGGTRSRVLTASKPLQDALFLGDGYVLCGAAGAQIARNGKVILEGAGVVDSCALRPDGEVIATASADKVIRLWDAHFGKLLTSRERQTGRLQIRFSADGESLVSASYDGSALVWDVAPDTGDAAACRELLDRRVPWQLLDNRLVPKPR